MAAAPRRTPRTVAHRLACARYEVVLSGERVPATLLPNGRHARCLALTPTPADGAEQQPESAEEPGRGWWARLAEWMKGSV